MKKNFLTFLILFIFFLMLALPSVTKQAANDGLNLWIFTVLPALLPYTIISSLLIQLNAFSAPCHFIERILKRKLPENEIFTIICGCLCGCPIGAKISADLYKSCKIPKSRAEFLMCAFNNISPSFLINYVFIEIYAPFISLSSTDKWLLYLIMITSTVTSAGIVSHIHNSAICNTNTSKHIIQANTGSHTIRTKPYSSFVDKSTSSRSTTAFKNTFSKSTIMSLFDSCILSAFEIQVKIGGYIILFSIINKLFLCTLDMSWLHSSLFGSVMELTSGLGLFTSAPNPPANLSCWLVPAFITSLTTFGGLCTIFQTKTVIADTDLSIYRYALSKILACIISFILTFVIYYAR